MYIGTIKQYLTLITLPIGNYTAAILITTVKPLLQTGFPNYGFSGLYNQSVRTIQIASTSNFRIMTHDVVLPKEGIAKVWYDNLGNVINQPDYKTSKIY